MSQSRSQLEPRVRSDQTDSFRERYMRLAGPNTARRFLQHCQDYIDCVSREAELREQGEVLDINSFTDLRRENSAIRLCFGLFEYVLGIDLPQEVFDDPTFMEVYWAAADLVCWANVSKMLLRRVIATYRISRMCIHTTWSSARVTAGTTS